MGTPGSMGDLPPKSIGVICTGDSFVATRPIDVVEPTCPNRPTTSEHQIPDRSHLKRKSSEGIKQLMKLELMDHDDEEDEEQAWEEDGEELAELWETDHDDYTEATGDVNSILNILGVQDLSPPPKRRGRKKGSENGGNVSDRSVQLDSDQIEGVNGFLWDTVPCRRDSIWNDDSNNASFDPGPTGDALKAVEPIECFKLFFTDQMMDHMISATNSFIDTETVKLTRRSRDSHFQPVGADEFSAMLGLVILSGTLQNNRCRTELLFDTTFSGDQFRATMPCARFIMLLNVLQFENSDTVRQQSSNDKFIPISKLWNSFLENCGKHYVPGSHVTIGKQMLSFRGHGCPFIVTTHTPVRHGIQIFLMVDNSSKYLINALPYLGKNTLPKGCTVENFAINRLVDSIRGSCRNVTMDEWFTSISLAEKLLSESKLTMIGQIKTNKKELPEFFSDIKYKNRKSGSSIFLHAGNLTAVSYKPCNNTGLLSLISTCHDGMVFVNSSGKPQIVLDYEATRGAVEAFEGNCSKMTTSRKTFRWPQTVFYHMIDMAMQNSYVIYYHNFLRNRQDPKARALSKADFALSLVRQLCTSWMRSRLQTPIPLPLRTLIHNCLGMSQSSKPRGSSNSDDDSGKDEIDATSNPYKLLGFTTDKDHLVLYNKCRQRCSVCPKKSQRKTRWLCGTCHKTICIEHSRRMCLPCWDKFKKRCTKNPQKS